MGERLCDDQNRVAHEPMAQDRAEDERVRVLRHATRPLAGSWGERTMSVEATFAVHARCRLPLTPEHDLAIELSRIESCPVCPGADHDLADVWRVTARPSRPLRAALLAWVRELDESAHRKHWSMPSARYSPNGLKGRALVETRTLFVSR